ncbi:hypothetical protein [Alkalilimnicola ehrlichii]|uniref:hypothetical protein n=1 Tax=Alkalilimnicola ehrlichii TaxID=351052 RepID=UPI0015F2542F|nr:hypothetical protein [Alkalilimnicola ehrlichii]
MKTITGLMGLALLALTLAACSSKLDERIAQEMQAERERQQQHEAGRSSLDQLDRHTR